MIKLIRFLYLYPCGYRLINYINKWAGEKYIKTRKPRYQLLWRKIRYPQRITQIVLDLILYVDAREC
jgi:hypothetical protein